LSRLV